MLTTFIVSCQNVSDLSSKIGETSITQASTGNGSYIPYADSLTLASFNNDKDIINYNLARKLALIEMDGEGFNEEMKWDGCHLSKLPVLVYGFDSRPKYYDYIVQDAEKNNIGTVTVEAKKRCGGIIDEVLPKVKDYTSLYTKANNSGMKIIANYEDDRYIGIVGKSGDSPTDVIDPATGESVTSQKEYTDDEIFKSLSDSLITSEKSSKAQINAISDPQVREEAIKSDTISAQEKIAQMKNSLDTLKMGRDAYWSVVNANTDSISNMSDNDIVNKSSKSLFSWIRRLFKFKNDSPKYLERYRNNMEYSDAPGRWCGPWAMGWIYDTKYGQDKYKYFESYAGTIGGCGLSFIINATSGQKPMFPSEMCLSMTLASKGGIRVNPFLEVGQWDGYNNVRDGHGPTLILYHFEHWLVAFGTKTTGSYFWRNYYYAVLDNGWYVSDSINRDYNTPYWYKAPWFIIYVRVHD